ncbi:heme peroxidase [Massarina eburnea CBS 473.64]|uniref:Peroxidase n=1 Tax=Massarina eburnea CBS 473.64 TaxID=1395130 RepID=A0A6A6RUP9_9PLEO|nr:heme peroxidase [Massarina eburnea CBS 473.64]
MKTVTLATLAALPHTLLAADYVWPGEHDHMEDLYMLQSGFSRFGFIDGILTCGFNQGVPGRQNAAEWIRTAYHDMATYDTDTGLGGIDASIMFETNREENKGTAFDNTFGHLASFYSVKSGGADLLALAVVGSMAACNGYEIPLRVGRVDATEAGQAGVPEPQQDLATHTEKFKKQGFNQTEMIELVACGHTLGGVHGANFPEITHDNTTGQVSHFEYGDSNAEFDNTVVTEYLSGNTSNLLVAGTNDTLNSDKRIFSADGNATMEKLADTKYFQTRCQDVMTKMIDTVPKDIVLSEPLKAIEVKPYINLLALNSNSTIDFSGYVRVRYGKGAVHPSADDLSAFLTYKDRSGKNVTEPITTTRPNWQSGTATGFGGGYSFVFFEWTTQIDADAGISGFHIHLTTTSTGTTEVYDNVGNTYPVKDTVLYQMKQSCSLYVLNSTTNAYDGQMTITAAVRSDSVADLNMHFASKVARPGVILGRFETQVEPFVATGKSMAGYDLYKVDGMPINSDSGSTSFDISLGDEMAVEFVRTTALTGQECAEL